jgi:hypothetical protein
LARTPADRHWGVDRAARLRAESFPAVAAACRRLGLAEPVQGTARLYAGEATGLIVRLPEWRFPIVIDIVEGNLQLDNYGGYWGAQTQLDQFLQAYAVE